MNKILGDQYNVLLITVAYFIIFGLSVQSPASIFEGLIAIMQAPDVLTTDYIYKGGFGASLVNAGIVTLIAIGMLKTFKHDIKSATISNMWLIIGFSFFGKNPLNVIPIWLGGWLYSKFMRQDFNKTIIVTLVATSLGPVVTVPWNLYLSGDISSMGMAIALAVLSGIAIGFIFEPVAVNILKVHEGFNLYNGGLMAGIIAMALTGVYQSFGFDILTVSFIDFDHHNQILVFLAGLSLLYLLIGLVLIQDKKVIIPKIRELNKTKNDYLPTFGPIIFINMAFLSVLCLAWAMGMHAITPEFLLQGPALGAILSTIGFGANGKNVPSSISLFLGATLAALLAPSLDITNPGVITILFFVPCLCPIPTKFGYHWGIVAGFLHMHFATSFAGPSGGMNLYNNGFAAGFVVIILYPLLLSLGRRREEKQNQLNAAKA